jgi:hypothetical protein
MHSYYWIDILTDFDIQEQITDLLSHRLRVEQSLAQQTTLVQKLEEKLRDTETVIRQHLDTKQQGGAGGMGQYMSSATSPPPSPERRGGVQRKYRPAGDSSDDVPRFKSKYKPTPKPSGAKSRLKWDDVHDEKDYDGGDRMLDLTYESGEISDEENWDGFYRRRSSSSTRAVSMLKDVLLHLISRDEMGSSSKASRRKVVNMLMNVKALII